MSELGLKGGDGTKIFKGGAKSKRGLNHIT